jgi:class 3 adenylate cyclase/tRNA A37 threonylcarbamoyladenosine biosynthesis protein TsaE
MIQKCPSCGQENALGSAVCVTCSCALLTACDQCGSHSPVAFNYCGICGASLREEPPRGFLSSLNGDAFRRVRSYAPEHLIEKLLAARGKIDGERRNVTILFADLEGFTTMSEKMDPERVYALLDTCLRGFAEEVHRYEGTIDKFIGDGIMALFGAPLAHENDPERAVRAGLGILDFLRIFNEKTAETYGTRLHVRIGLNAGTVIAGVVGPDSRMQYTVVGDTVNLASRLEELAERDTILVSRSVWKATNSLFKYLPRGNVTIKGRRAPVEAFQVVGPRKHPGRVRGIRGLRAPMIGRNRELEHLHQVIERLARKNQGQLVLLTGEAGIGKSRLVAESKQFMRLFSLQPFEVACPPHTARLEYRVFQRLLAQHFDIPGGADEETRHKQLRQAVHKLLPIGHAAEVLPFLQRLLDVPIADERTASFMRRLSPKELRSKTFLALRRLVLAILQKRPLIFIVDDLHWIDKDSLNLLLSLIALVDKYPLLLWLVSRPYEGPAVSMIHQLGRKVCAGHYTPITLNRLSLFDSHILLDSLLKPSTLPPQIRQSIPEMAEGNPFFLEEIVRLLIEQGAIWRTDGEWRAKTDLDVNSLSIPQSLHALLTSRLDRLSEEPRHVLQCCAVIGPRIPHDLLAAMVSAEFRPVLDQAVDELLHREFLEREPGRKRSYAFRHTLVRETVYNMMLSQRRKELHLRVGHCLDELYAGRLQEVIDLRAYHLGRAADTHPPEEILSFGSLPG